LSDSWTHLREEVAHHLGAIFTVERRQPIEQAHIFFGERE